MTTDPKRNEELKDADLEGVAGGAGGGDVQNHEETGDDSATQPTGDYGEPTQKPSKS